MCCGEGPAVSNRLCNSTYHTLCGMLLILKLWRICYWFINFIYLMRRSVYKNNALKICVCYFLVKPHMMKLLRTVQSFQFHCISLVWFVKSLLCFHTPVYSLTSPSTNLLTIPFAHRALSTRSFSVTSPKIWNLLPPDLHPCNYPDTLSVSTSRPLLPTSLSSPQVPPSWHLRFSICWRVRSEISFTYYCDKDCEEVSAGCY